MKRDTRNIKIETAQDEDIQGKQYYNYPLVAIYKNKRVIIGSGTSDNIDLFRLDKDRTVLLSTNFGLDYAGIEIINWDTGEIEQDVFMQSVREISQDLKKDFFDYTENTQVDILMQWIY